ncbi:MAG: DUF2939 domain-containing protein [Schwartzia sp. (in: firmicutes)]
MALHFSKQGKIRVFLACLIALLATVGGGYWYFGHYTKTPAYSLRMIEEAVAAHDEKKFAQYVDVDSIAASASDALLDGMMDADRSLSEESRATISGFTAMFRDPLRESFKGILLSYVRTGTWGGQVSGEGTPIDADVILSRAGLKAAEFRGVASLEQDAEGGTATVGLRVYQEEAEEECIFHIQLLRTESGLWQAKEITNFREFIALVMKARLTHLKAYLAAADEILNRHEGIIRTADRKLVETLQRGSLGDTATRQAMKKIVEEEILPDWHQREEELQALSVPMQAQSLQRLRLRICAAQIQYGEAYAEWLETKSVATVRKANELLKEAKTLEHEAKVLHQMQMKKQ